LEGLLRNRDYAKAFFNRIGELHLEPKLILFPRNHSQSINSRYAEVVKDFSRCEPFEAFVQGVAKGFVLRYSPLIELADAHDAELIGRPFTRKTMAHGVGPEFLQAVGLESVAVPRYQRTPQRSGRAIYRWRGPRCVAFDRQQREAAEVAASDALQNEASYIS
jgi:hypothetical protein